MDIGDDQLISIGLVLALLALSKVRDLLDNGGLVAATFTGLTVSLMGHWTWLIALLTFLVIGSSATKWKLDEKKLLSLEEANEGLRGWKNVLANGGAVSIVAIYNFFYPGEEWIYFAAIASISVALSDTLASEIGSLDIRTRSITTLQSVPAGTNGGMSPTGTVAALFGAIIISIVGVIFSPEDSKISEIQLLLFLSIIGWLGCQVDSLLGAVLENRGYLGKHSVNFLATFSGSLMAIIFYYQFL
ncbi:MAG: hypothetical protein CMA51_04375 [Euryarchaeota archaeon]|nr:hypothetical protein [Euryarchaeota archaeon]|tara:strand:- start:2484 stop:3218 length:735 start_codon:yes stop_codon:yes gene_type:complete